MRSGKARGLAVFMAAALLMTTLVAPVQATIAVGNDNIGIGGGSMDRVRMAVYFLGLGRTVIRGNSMSEAEQAKAAYVVKQMHAVTIMAHMNIFVTAMLTQLCGKLKWTDPAYAAVHGMFFRQIMYQLYNPFRHGVFVIWCMLVYLLMSSPTGMLYFQGK